MSAKFSTIKAAIVSKLQADADLGGTGQVFDYEPALSVELPDPFATVTSDSNEGEYETTTENKRTFIFTVRIFVERTTRGASAAETLLTDMVDRLIDAIDTDNTLGVAGVLMTKAVTTTWSYVLSDKEYRMAEIKLSTVASIDVSA